MADSKAERNTIKGLDRGEGMKEAYYFSHDSNARHDPKITAMRGVYGAQGYGWFWMLVEMMREADGYRLDMKSKYAFNAYAMQLQSESNAIASFVHDCINEFQLFQSDGEHFWTESLLRRMKDKEVKSEKARESANARWKNGKRNASASEDHANAPKNDALKESKGKEIKERDLPPLPAPDLRGHIQNLLDQNQVEDYTIYHIDSMASYHGVVDVEVIEYAINKAKKKHGNYALRTLEGLVKDGKTKKDSVQYIRAVPDKPAKTDPELESRRVEIARNKWISEGNDPDEFDYAASGDRGRTGRIRSGVP